jgi:uridylate cyclase
MSLTDDLTSEVTAIFRDSWTRRDGEVVPEPEDLKLSNDAVELDGAVLYADLSDSTGLVNAKVPTFAAEVYKTFLHCAAKIIRAQGGAITAYDGDRIMAVFIGNSKNTSAVKAALKINYARTHIINPALKAQYNSDYEVKHVVGIDTSKLFAARTGVRGANDLVWVGRSANYAAKLAALDASYTWITASVFDHIRDAVKVFEGRAMWEAHVWNTMNKMRIYRSSWRFKLDYNP